MGGSWQEAAPLPDEGRIFAIEMGMEGAAIVLVLRGELDLVGASPLASALESAIATGRSRIVLELGHLSFIDGAGIAMIERAGRRVAAQGGELTVRHPRPHVRRVFALCRALSGAGEDLDRGPAGIASTRPAGTAVGQ
jgi:anti-sigma B factor antagonist